MPKKNKAEYIPAPTGDYTLGSGRTPKALQLKNYSKILRLLDDSAEDALKVLTDGLSDENPWVRIRCAETILKKYIPDKKIKELTGPGGGPVQIANIDQREAVINIINILDELDLDDVKKKAKDGSIRLLETDEGREREAEGPVEKEAAKN